MDATTRSMPKSGEVRRTSLPGTFDGIRFEIQRLIRYVQDGCRHPLVISTARRIVEEYLPWLRRGEVLKEVDVLRVVHGWAQANYQHVPNPPGVDIIETPVRQIKRLLVPPEAEAMIYEPFIRDARTLMKPQPPRITGSLANSMSLVLSLLPALGVRFVRMRFGGQDGTVYYPWASARAGGRWHDLDILRPFDDPEAFEHVEDINVPLP